MTGEPPFWRDPRLAPVRQDVAARAWADAAPGRRIADGEPHQVRAGSAAIRAEPGPDAMQVTQALHGERFEVFDRRGDWAWGQLAVDRYVGWIEGGALSDRLTRPTHWVSALRTLVFSRPDPKAPVVVHLPLNARLEVVGSGERFVETVDGWVFGGHVSPLGAWRRDFVSVAERFIGAPYLWGGREMTGIDCSGLVQAALMAAGRSVLRDSEMQEATLGERLDGADPGTDLIRGDLLFWPGHVGVMADAKRLLHANAWHMATEIEPLQDALERIEPLVGRVRTVRRMRPD
jgi:cell wall-associated NlpC family hydrolase